MEICFFPVFWDDKLILDFFVDFSNILNQSGNVKDIRRDLNSQLNIYKVIPSTSNEKTFPKRYPSNRDKSKVIAENIFKCGWISDVWSDKDYPVGKYLLLCDKSYNGYLLSDLLRAIRNLKAHEFENEPKCYDQNNKQDAIHFFIKIKKKIKCGWVQFWIKNFPELLCVAYSVAVSHIATLEKNSQTECFIKKYYLKEVAKMKDVPISLPDFAKNFIGFTGDNIRNTKKANETWLYCVNPKEALIQFVNYSRKPAIIQDRDIVEMKIDDSPDGTTRNALKVTVTRKLAEVPTSLEMFLCSSGEPFPSQIIAKGNNKISELTWKTVTTDMQTKPTTKIASYIFSENIISALIELQNLEGEFIVLTTRSYEEVRRVATSFISSHSNQNPISEFILKWENLLPSYSYELLKRDISLQSGSKMITSLEKVYHENKIKLNTAIKGEELLNIMHNKNLELLPSNLPSLPFCVTRTLYQVNIPAGEVEVDCTGEAKFAKDLMYQSQDCLKKVVNISDIPGSGKSTFIQKMASKVIQKDKNTILLYKKAEDLSLEGQKIKAMNDIKELIKILWPKSCLQQDVACYLLKTQKLLLVIDDVHLLSKDRWTNLKLFIDTILKFEIKLVVLMATRENEIQEVMACIESKNVEKFCYHFKPFGDGDKKLFFQEYLKDTVFSSSSQGSINVLSKNCINITKTLGDHAHTPFTCMMALKYYQDHPTQDFKIHNMKSTKDVHDYFIDSYLNRQLSQLHITGLKAASPSCTSLISTDTNGIYALIKHIYLWPCAEEALNQLFEHSKLDISKVVDTLQWCVGYAEDFYNSSKHLNQGSLNDYFIAWFVNKCLHFEKKGSFYKKICNFVSNELLVIQEDTFKYNGILFSLNCIVDADKILKALKHADKVPDEICDIVFLTLNNNYETLFNGLVKFVAVDSLSQKYNKFSSLEVQYSKIFHNAILLGNMKPINFFLDIAKINVNTQVIPDFDTALHCVFKYSPLLGDDKIKLVKSIIDHGGNIALENSKDESVFETAVANEEIEEEVLEALISSEINFEAFMDNWKSWKTKIDNDRFPKLGKYFEDQMEALEYYYGKKQGPLLPFSITQNFA